MAGVGIVYDSATHTQRFFLGHNDDVTCAAMHPDGKLVATGQVSSVRAFFEGSVNRNSSFHQIWLPDQNSCRIARRTSPDAQKLEPWLSNVGAIEGPDPCNGQGSAIGPYLVLVRGPDLTEHPL